MFEKIETDLREKGALLENILKGKIKKWFVAHGDLNLFINADVLLQVLRKLRDEKGAHYQQLMDVCVVDYLGRAPKRFQVVYHLLSVTENQRVRVCVPLEEGQAIQSACGVFASAGWWEREAYDMFGVVFEGHPDLRRILSDYNFKGHPLLKDFPVTGYVQVRYDEEKKRVVEEPVKLQQAYRTFDTLSPWQGMSEAFKSHQEFKDSEVGGNGKST